MSATTTLRGPTAPGSGEQAGAAPLRRITLLTTVAYFMVTLDALVVVTALPSIQRDLGGNVEHLQWTINAYTLAFASGIITASTLGDRFGRRRVYGIGLAIFTIASALCALAPSLGVLIGFRAVQGIGAAIVMPLGLTLLTSAFPPERRGAAVGIWGGVAGLGVAAGPLVGGAVTQGLDWHWIFWVNVPIGAVVWASARRWLPESRGERSHVDLPAMVTVAAGVGMLVWGLVQGPTEGWGSARTTLPLLAAVVLLVAFVVRESRAATPMIPLSLFRRSGFAAAAITLFLMAGSTFATAFITSEYFQFARDDGALATGLRFLPWTATPFLVAPVAGALSDRLGARRLAVPGLAMQAIGFLWIARLAVDHAGYGEFVVPFILAGVGVSMALPTVPAAGLNAAPAELLGKATGVLTTVQQLGFVVGVAAVTVAFDASGSLADPDSVTSGYAAAVVVTACLSGLAALAGLGLRAQKTRGRSDARPVNAGERFSTKAATPSLPSPIEE